MMKLVNSANMLRLLREIDLGALKSEAERRFGILIAGDEHLTSSLAAAISADEGKGGVHPWLFERRADAAGDALGANLALIVSENVELNAAETELLERLSRNNVPVMVLILSDAAAARVGSELPRPLERLRVVMRNLEAAAMQETFSPAFLKIVPDDLKLTLAKQLPLFRACVAKALIEDTSSANAIYAASTGVAQVVPILNVPLNVADTFVLTKNQLVMAYKLTLAYGREGRPQEVMREVVGVIGGGFFFRQMARELVGLIPVAGILPKIAVSYAGTVIIGRTVQLWLTHGERLSVSDMRQYYDVALERGRKLAETLLEGAKEGYRKGIKVRVRVHRSKNPKAFPPADSESASELDG